MEQRNLKLIRDRRAVLNNRMAVWFIAAVLAAAAVVTSLNGADRARQRFDPRDLAEAALQQALSQGGDADQVLAKLRDLRRVIGRRPLDSRTRVVYAALLLSLSRSTSDLLIPAFHARVAASLSPVTVPVVRVAVLVLASSGQAEVALPLIREMFNYDPQSAAPLLTRAEPLLRAEHLPLALPERPEAWLAWSRELIQRGHREESDNWLEEGYRRWPENLHFFRSVAARMIREAKLEELGTLFPDDAELPELPGAAALFAYRAMYKGMNNDIQGAREDLARALELSGDAYSVKLLAGWAYKSIGDYDDARRQWHAAFFSLPPGSDHHRLQVLLGLARLEQRHGEPAAALRHWRQVLEIDPDHEEAKRRISALTGA